VAVNTVGLFVPAGPGASSWALDPSFRLLAGVTFALFAVGVLISGYGARRRAERAGCGW
jgi:hypothetical protein